MPSKHLTCTVRALLVLLLLKGTGLTTSLHSRPHNSEGWQIATPCPIDCPPTLSYLELDLVLDRVRHDLLLGLRAVAMMMVWWCDWGPCEPLRRHQRRFELNRAN